MTKITSFVWNLVDDGIISELDGAGVFQAVYTNERKAPGEEQVVGMVTLWIFPGGSQVGKHYSAEQWAAWVGEQRESELSVAEFCDWIGVSPNSFDRWRQKLATTGRPLARKGREAQRLPAKKGSMSSVPKMVPLTILTSPVVEIDVPCGAFVRVPNEDRSLRRVLRILLEADQTADVSPIATPCIEHHTGGRR